MVPFAIKLQMSRFGIGMFGEAEEQQKQAFTCDTFGLQEIATTMKTFFCMVETDCRMLKIPMRTKLSKFGVDSD